ncbi:proteasome, beta subunit [Pseudonocardia dioxanivorans CB1190]|uniref:Proteasome subunit beta n=1 Tax=Pseudonocardia dioxanivorans (strain ATCC 55486 / DSM 44775 / JCM 13855 / CB1190) TaxID=675635 RepID=F4CX53_PSEUX|nr:proteasome subunit beta [Pseudonocardia dioxanivorans]AEA25494.1 proteasome, beta subunit [Pseudonocardia dioxanivorans CB1190]
MDHRSPFDARHPGLLDPFTAPATASFTDYVAATAPHLLPGRSTHAQAAAHGAAGLDVPHGTTIVALVCADGVVIAGDRRATAGNVIAQRDIEKVFVTDSYSAVGIAGSAGIALEMVRLFTVDLEHYEKIEGVPLSLDGKANKLAGMVRQNLGAAMQGFVVVPLFVGYDTDAPDASKAGRIVTYDPTGGRYDEWLGYYSVGSGSVFAKSALKKLHDPANDLATTIRTAVEALYDAADDDTATGGPDMVRRIYPIVVSITAEGAQRRSEEEIAGVVDQVIAGRTEKPGG